MVCSVVSVHANKSVTLADICILVIECCDEII